MDGFNNKIYLLVFWTLSIVRIGNAQVVNSFSGYPDQIVLNVTEDLTSSMAFNWRTDSTQTHSKIQVAKENGLFNTSQNPLEMDASSEALNYKGRTHWYHSVLIENLEPATRYVYRVGLNDKWSEWINFKTIAKTNEPLKFLYFGDVQTNIKSHWTRIAKQAVKTMPDAQLVLYAGDMVNRGNNLNEWEEWFYATSGLHQNIPIMPASGNHDHGDDDAGEYKISAYWNKQFNLPNNGIKSLNETSYCINIQNIKFVVLNTEMLEEDETIKKEQVKWLEKVLATNKQEWIILLMHHPIYSTKKNRDNKDLRELIKTLIDKYKVDLVLQGHDHTYARGKDKVPMTNKQKSHATYVVTVSGPKMSEVLEAEWMDKAFSYTQLFQGIEIDKNRLTFSTYNVLGEVMDRFIISKNNGVNSISE